MKSPSICRAVFAFVAALAGCLCAAPAAAADAPVRDVTWFLQRLRTVEHLPQLEESHTALASTWDRSGGNADGTDFKRIDGTTNILFDAEGPGCVHRLFTGGSEPGRDDLPGYLRVDDTRVQIFLDRNPTPLFDVPVIDFFNPAKGPIPYPLAGDKQQKWTYPGSLFPIPYARHCRVQLVNPGGTNWGCYWQIAYTTYPPGTAVESLTWPLPTRARAELDAVRKAWLEAQTAPPAPPEWTLTKSTSLKPGRSLELRRSGAGVIREVRVAVEPATPEVLRALRLIVRWNGAQQPSVDVSVGDFFGQGYAGHAEAAQFNSLLLGVTSDEAYTRFPMPYAKGARILFRNDSRVPIARLRVALQIERLPSVPSNWGWFNATHREAPAASPNEPTFGLKHAPGHLVLEHRGRGKYVGVLMREDWPHDGWWGEGDWLIWSDETDWPPSYHGTGSEEYFNSGWCLFDRKAVSGYVAVHPGHPTQYSFHLNDAFQFQRNIRVAVETMGWDKADQQIRDEHPIWASTAYWYSR
jgi:hypothetical protein